MNVNIFRYNFSLLTVVKTKTALNSVSLLGIRNFEHFGKVIKFWIKLLIWCPYPPQLKYSFFVSFWAKIVCRKLCWSKNTTLEKQLLCLSFLDKQCCLVLFAFILWIKTGDIACFTNNSLSLVVKLKHF